MNGIDYLDVTQEDLLGKTPAGIPMVNTLTNLDDMDEDQSRVLNRIRIRDYLKNIAGGAGEGIMKTLAGQDRRSTLARAGLGSLLFGFNPATALFGAFLGSKAPDIYSSLQGKNINPLSFIRERKAQREAKKAAEAQAEFDKLNAARQIRDSESMSGGAGETTQGTFGSSVNDPTTFSDYS